MGFDRNRVVSSVMRHGKKIFINDLTACATTADVLAALAAMEANTRLQTEKMRTVTDITGVNIDSQVMDRANKLGKELFNRMALRSAIVGVVGYKRILLRAFTFFSGIAPVPFDDREAAIEYAAKD
jgi:hypothetical protein